MVDRKEALKRIRRVAAMDLGDPFPLSSQDRRSNPYGYQPARVLEYAWGREE